MDVYVTSRSVRFLASLAGAVALAALSLAALASRDGRVPLAAAQAPVDLAAAAAPAPRFQAGELLVRFRPGEAVASARDVLSAYGLRQVDEIPALGVRRVRVPAGQEEALAVALRQDPRVAYAELNGILTVQETPNDPYFVNQWGMTRIGAPAAWDQVTGTYPITIAVVDTGVWGSHPDLVGKMVDGWFTYTENSIVYSGPITAGTPNDPYGHGTHVAGIAAASTNNEIGVAGVNWGAPIMPFRSQASNGNGTDYDVAAGVLWVTDHGAKVINISLGGPDYVQTLADAVAYAWQHGALVVAAAGNSAAVSPTYPAAYPFALAVAATDSNDVRPYGYAHGPWVDVAAPGLGVLSTLPSCGQAHYMCSDIGYGQASGTSMATPNAAGLAALIWSANPALTNAQVTYVLTSTAEKVGGIAYDANGWNEYLGYGRINAAAAILDPRVLLYGPAVADSRSLITYTLVLHNRNAVATNVVITDALPVGASFVSASDGGVRVKGVMSWTVPSLSALETVTRLLTVTATHDLTNSDYGASSAAGRLAAGTGPVVTRVVGPVLTIAKAGPPWFVSAAPVTYTLAVSNGGVQAASGLVVTDALPVGASFLAASDSGTLAGGVVSWTVGGLAIGQTVTRTLTVSATQALVNSVYGAACREGASVAGSQAVTSAVVLYHLYLPVVLRNGP